MGWTGFKHQLQREGWLADGSFEHQAEVWGSTYIPSLREFDVSYDLNDLETGWQIIGAANYDIDDTIPVAGTSNWWIQIGPPTATEPRWVVSDDRAYPDEPGYQGRWSARYEFDAEPTSPWLVPVNPLGFNPIWSEQSWTDEMIESNIYTAVHDLHRKHFNIPEGYMPIAMNPPLRNTTWACHAYSDGPCTIEFNKRYWGWWGGVDPTFSAEVENATVSAPVPTDAWTEIKFVCPVDPALWPNYPTVDNGYTELFFFQTYKLRVTGGLPGQRVYIDNCWLWPDMTTQGTGLLTIGVAEWVRDEKGMYIGAHLWFKTGSE